MRPSRYADREVQVAMSFVPDPDEIEERLAALPVVTFQAGDAILRAGSKTGDLFFLKKGTAAVIRDGIEFARVTQPNAVIGEQSALLDQPHTADVRAVEVSQFYVASGDLLARDPVVLLYVTAVLARRLNAAVGILIDLKTQLKADQRGSLVDKTLETMEGLLGGVLRLPAQSLELRSAASRADAFLAAHPKAKDQLRRIFTLKLAAVHEGEEPTRRRALRSEFTDEEWQLVKELAADPYRILVMATPAGEETYAEVAHEAIFRRWDELHNWIAADHEFLAWRTGLEAARNAKSRAFLMGTSLRQAQGWRATRGEDLSTVDRGFIDRSTKRESKVKARTRALAYVLLVGIVAGLLFLNRSFVQTQWYWYTQVRPYVLSPEAEQALNPGGSFRECAKDCPEMIVVPEGAFMMGSLTNEAGRDSDESPQHEVTIAKPFAMSKFEVTFDEWDTCVAYGDCDPRIGDSGFGRGRKPVINVTWYDAKRYAAWLSKMTGKTYRLPSEAEWEYAARAGAETLYSWGDEIGNGIANCVGCGSEWDGKQTAPVGSFAANAFDLSDMHGNVSEWVEDCYHANYDGAPANGSAWTAGGDCSSRILRGGSWDNSPDALRSASRGRGANFAQSNKLGFRVVRELNP